MRVYKHELDMGVTLVGMQGDPVHFGFQGGKPFVWAEHHPNEEMLEYRFEIVGTGHDIDGDVWHIGTCQEGPFVWHLYQHVK